MTTRRAFKGHRHVRPKLEKDRKTESISLLENHNRSEYIRCTCGAQRSPFSENLEWLSSKDAAIYLRKFLKNGEPSLGAIRAMVCRKQITARRFQRRLYFSKRELDRLIDTSEYKGGY